MYMCSGWHIASDYFEKVFIFYLDGVPLVFKAINHSMYVPGFSYTPVDSISVISVVLYGYIFVPLFAHRGFNFFKGVTIRQLAATLQHDKCQVATPFASYRSKC